MASISSTVIATPEPTTPRQVIPDMYVGLSPSFSTHFLSSSNIAIPSLQDYSYFSPFMNASSPTLNMTSSRFLYSSPSTPSSPSAPQSRIPKVKQHSSMRLSAARCNGIFSSESDGHTRLTRTAKAIKKNLQYFGTFGMPLEAANTSSSLPCTPLRHPPSIDDPPMMSVTPMRLQYRLKQQMGRHRAILLRSPDRTQQTAEKGKNLITCTKRMGIVTHSLLRGGPQSSLGHASEAGAALQKRGRLFHSHSCRGRFASSRVREPECAEEGEAVVPAARRAAVLYGVEGG